MHYYQHHASSYYQHRFSSWIIIKRKRTIVF
jgi:hypothetical protein